MGRKLKILASLPGTIWFNFRYLPFKQALKLPVWIAANVRIKKLFRGGIVLKTPIIRLGQIHIGYHEADGVDSYREHTIIDIEKGGKLILFSDAHVGLGAKIIVKESGKLIVGDHFAISGTTTIICAKSISFGGDVQLSWNSLICDTDAHSIYSADGSRINPDAPIVIGNHVWMAANTTILKGTQICDNTIIASNSLVNGKFTEGNCIIGGSPAKKIKNIGSFRI